MITAFYTELSSFVFPDTIHKSEILRFVFSYDSYLTIDMDQHMPFVDEFRRMRCIYVYRWNVNGKVVIMYHYNIYAFSFKGNTSKRNIIGCGES